MSHISNIQPLPSVLEIDSSEAVAPFSLEDVYNYAAKVSAKDQKAIEEDLSKPKTENANDQYETQTKPIVDDNPPESNDTLNIQNRDSDGSESENTSPFGGFGIR